MGIGKICRLYNISYQVGLTEPGLPSDSEMLIQTLYKKSMV